MTTATSLLIFLVHVDIYAVGKRGELWRSRKKPWEINSKYGSICCYCADCIEITWQYVLKSKCQ